MTQANIVSVWAEGGRVFMAASVDDGGQRGVVEYIGSVEKDDAFDALTNAKKKATLIGAVKAVRDAQVTPRTSIGGIMGTTEV